jgi:hypothetical protein
MAVTNTWDISKLIKRKCLFCSVFQVPNHDWAHTFKLLVGDIMAGACDKTKLLC